MRLDDDLKKQALPILEDYGLTLPQAFKLFLNQVVRTKTVPLSFDYAKEPTLTEKANEKLLRSIEELRNGDYTESTLDELLELKHAKN
jgi:addiction module RelB/DinJ family antitoxin